MCVAADSAGRLRYMGHGLGKGRGDMKKRNPAVDYAMIVAGTFLIGFAIKNIYDPVSMVTGGVSGVAIIAKELWFIKRTLFATVMLSVSLYVLPEASYLGSDLFLSALFGGIISGVGTGLVFLTSCTTGGTDLLAALIQKRLKHYTLAQIMQVLDGLIVVAGASVFGIRTALYALIAIFCVAKVTDGLIEGLKFSKQAYIISEHYREIAEAIMEQMGRGVTSIKARGMYSDQEKRMLFCVVSKKEIVRLKEIVAEFDSSAFVIVSDAREVFGEGFIEY